MRKLQLVPSQAGYGVTMANDVVYTRLDGGVGKARLDQVGGAAVVRVTWTLSGAEYQYFMAFWRVLGNGAERFLVDLVLSDAAPQEHVALFKPGTLSLTSAAGDVYQVRAELDAEPVTADPDMDELVVELYPDYTGLFTQLEQLVNFDLDLPAFNP